MSARSIPVKIAGMGWYLPEKRVTSIELEQDLGLPSGWVEKRTGILERRYANGETTVCMAAHAGRKALVEAGVSAGELDAIVGASCGSQQLIPCTAAFVQRELGAPDGRSACFDINATCVSFLFALQAAGNLIAGGVYKNVLVFSSETAAHSLNPREPESAVLIGDAAAAAVLTRSAPGESSALAKAEFSTFSSGADLTSFLGGGTLHHPNDPTTTREMNQFHMNGPSVFRQTARALRPFVDRFFDGLGWQRADVDAVVPHQSSRHGLDFIATRLGFRSGQIVVNLPYRGNCIAASIPLALAEAVENGRIQRGHRVILLGTGAGLTLGMAALTY